MLITVAIAAYLPGVAILFVFAGIVTAGEAYARRQKELRYNLALCFGIIIGAAVGITWFCTVVKT